MYHHQLRLSLPVLYFRLTCNLLPTVVSLLSAVVTAATVVDLSVPQIRLAPLTLSRCSGCSPASREHLSLDSFSAY